MTQLFSRLNLKFAQHTQLEMAAIHSLESVLASLLYWILHEPAAKNCLLSSVHSSPKATPASLFAHCVRPH